MRCAHQKSIQDAKGFQLAAACAYSFMHKNNCSSLEITTIYKALLVGLESDDEAILEKVLEALAYLSDEEEHVSILVEGGYIPRLIQLASSSSSDYVVSRSVRALGNIAVGKVAYSKYLCEANFLPLCLKLLKQGFSHHEILWILSNISVNDECYAKKVLDADFDTIISIVYPSADKSVIEELGWLFSNLLIFEKLHAELYHHAKTILLVMTKVSTKLQSSMIESFQSDPIRSNIVDKYLKSCTNEDKEEMKEVVAAFQDLMNRYSNPETLIDFIQERL